MFLSALTTTFAQTASNLNTTTTTCTVNGQPSTDCGSILAGIGIFFLVFGILFLVCLVFWVMSLIHLIKHPDVPNRVLWIVLHFVLLGVLAGPIYMIFVKRSYDKKHAAAQSTGAPQAGPAIAQPQPATVTPGASPTPFASPQTIQPVSVTPTVTNPAVSAPADVAPPIVTPNPSVIQPDVQPPQPPETPQAPQPPTTITPTIQ